MDSADRGDRKVRFRVFAVIVVVEKVDMGLPPQRLTGVVVEVMP